jgi:hypothetical protein
METENLNKAATNNGLIIGVIGTMLGIVTYYVAPAMMGSMFYGITLTLISLVLYIIFTLDLRKKIGGYWTFREALKGIFLMSFVAGILTMAVNFVFYKFIEPGAFEKISGYVSTGLSSTYSKMGMDQDTIDKTVAKALEAMKGQFDPGIKDLIRNLVVGVLIQFIMSMIFAAIFKKNPPIFASIDDEIVSQ